MLKASLALVAFSVCGVLSAQPSSPAVLDHVPGRVIVHHKGAVSDLAASQLFSRMGVRVHSRLEKLGISVIEVDQGSEERVAQSLRSHPLFRDAEVDHYAHVAATPNDQYFGSQWHLAKIQAPSAWNISTGSSTPIAVIDSGVDTSHPDLASRLIAGWNFVLNSSTVTDTMGHGTAVTGVIGAISNNGIGVSGVTWQNPILPIVAVDATGYAAYSNIAAAIQYAADRGARVINVSVGGSSPSSALQSAVDYAWNAGAVVVGAAMNNASNTPYYPAACNHAIAVSATDENDNLATFSDYGSWITLSAPGTNILTTQLGGAYSPWEGTSLATPVVTSVAALALAANPSLTPQALVTLLEQNADDLGAAGYDGSFGWGRVNAYRTLAAATGGSQTTTPVTTPPATSSLPIRVNAGGGAYTDGYGNTWATDNGYSGGTTYTSGASIAGTQAAGVYQSCRYAYGSFSYSFAVPNGSYSVTLKFAEPSRFGVGLRQFNAAINGATVLTNFDIFARAGGGFIAVDQTFPVTVTGGQIFIQLSPGAADLPLINGIDIEAGSVAAPPTPTSSTSLRMNAGGGSYVDSSGNSWAADNSYSGGNTYAVSAGIGNTSTPMLYQTCRYGNFTYAFSVPNGNYRVTLKFAEPSRFGVGLRQFNAAINGSQVLSNFDIYAAAGGGNLAVDKAFAVTVTGGSLAIQFSSGAADLPLVNAIDIEPATATTSSTVVRIDAGGVTYTDASGNVWSADNSYSGGNIYMTSASIGNTSVSPLYQTCRYGNFIYTVAVPNGTYSVTLKFAEPSRFGVGLRQFNVLLNGAVVLSNFDIYASAGGGNLAVDRTFPVTATGGVITLQFLSGGADLPLVNAINIE